MAILNILLTFILNVYPPQIFAPESSLFTCDGELLETTIYNNQNGIFTIVAPLQEIDAGGFVVLHWKELSLMLPRTFNTGETSFTDGKWWWSYEDPEHPQLRLRKRRGDIKDFKCDVIPS